MTITETLTSEERQDLHLVQQAIDIREIPNPISLIKAKINEDGWTTGTYGDYADGGPVCLVGAERAVFWTIGSHHSRLGIGDHRISRNSLRRLAERCITNAIQQRTSRRVDHVHYNDGIAANKEAVVDMLADAAREWEEKYRS